MRRSEFNRRMEDEFGSAYAASLLSSLHLSAFDATAAEALDGGADPGEVWLQICLIQSVPQGRWLGRDLPVKDSESSWGRE